MKYSSAEFLTIGEGLCAQIIHIGPYDDEPATVAIIDECKSIEAMIPGSQGAPEWFTAGMKCVQKAPSAVNAQPVTFKYNNGVVTASVSGKKMREYIDLGIAMYHFEVGAGGGKWELKNVGKFTPSSV